MLMGMKPGIAINQVLKINHPTEDPLDNQSPGGQVYEPLSEDACAGLAVGMALFGHDRFGVPMSHLAVIMVYRIWQNRDASHGRTVVLRLSDDLFVYAVHWNKVGMATPTPGNRSVFCINVAKWKCFLHCSPQTERHLKFAMNGRFRRRTKCNNYGWGKSPLPIHTTFAQTREGIEKGGVAVRK
jgi:hypothetical protein